MSVWALLMYFGSPGYVSGLICPSLAPLKEKQVDAMILKRYLSHAVSKESGHNPSNVMKTLYIIFLGEPLLRLFYEKCALEPHRRA